MKYVLLKYAHETLLKEYPLLTLGTDKFTHGRGI